MFLRKTSVGREPLAVAMSGVRMGERVLQVGLNEPRVAGALAAKAGLTGESTIVVPDEATADRARRAASDAGALAQVMVHSLERLSFDTGSFDVAVIHNRDGQLATPGTSVAALGECRRVLRSGGRVVVLETGTRTGLGGMFRPRALVRAETGEATIGRLEAAGFKAVRILGDRDGYRFIEGLKVEATTRGS